MILVTIGYKNEVIDTLRITGHADYSEAGSDIVCAGVSSLVLSNIMYAQVNKLGKFTVKQAHGLIDLQVKKHDQILDQLLSATLFGLTLIEEEYKKYIKIKTVEV